MTHRLWILIGAIVLLLVIVWELHLGSSQVSIPGLYLCKKTPNDTLFESEVRLHDKLEEAEMIWMRGVGERRAAELESPIPDKEPWAIPDRRILWDYFYPNFNCPHNIERIGRVGDGGKWVCGLSHFVQDPPCVMYSYGISNDTSFEEQILKRTNCVVFAYDYTVSPEKVKLPKFKKLGLGPSDTKFLRTLKSEMQVNGHDFIDILKVDIEGGEFQALSQIIKDFPNGLPFGQLLIELHLNSLPQSGLFKRFKTWWEELEYAGLRAFHSELNLYVIVMGHKHPAYMEMSFLNVKVDHRILHVNSADP